jgi:hypothetical protein
MFVHEYRIPFFFILFVFYSGIHVVWISFCLLGNSLLELLFVLGEEANVDILVCTYGRHPAVRVCGWKGRLPLTHPLHSENGNDLAVFVDLFNMAVLC